MNYQMIGFVIGRILWTEAALLLLPALVTLLYGEPALPFLGPILLLLIAGLPFRKKPKQTSLYARDGFAVVALAWVLMSAFGALPFLISGYIPSFVDAFWAWGLFWVWLTDPFSPLQKTSFLSSSSYHASNNFLAVGEASCLPSLPHVWLELVQV